MDDTALVPFFLDSTDADDPKELVAGFGDEFDSEGDGGTIPDEDIYDAINSETFGAEISSLTVDDNDLAEFAIRTANLAMLDDLPSSSKPPDPSQIPIPKIASGQSLEFLSSIKEQRAGNSFKDEGIDGFFGQLKQAARQKGSEEISNSPSIWGSGTFNGINSLMDIYSGQQLKSQSHSIQESAGFYTPEPAPQNQQQKSRSIEKKAPFPANLWPSSSEGQNGISAIGAESLERKLRYERSAFTQVTAQGGGFSPIPINAADLERELLEESENKKREQQQKQQQQQHLFQQQDLLSRIAGLSQNFSLSADSASTILSSSPGQQHKQQPQQMNFPPPKPLHKILPPPPLGFQNWQQQQKQIATSSPPNQIPFPPPPTTPMGIGVPTPPLAFGGVPPPHPLMFPPGLPLPQITPIHPLALLQHAAASAAAFHHHHQQQQQQQSSARQSVVGTPHLGSVSATPHPLQPAMMHPAEPAYFGQPSGRTQMPQLAMIPASLHPRIEKQQHRSKALPSGKTIADYALDPYAGLMSTKEREWLIKIHLIQCLGTGDPMNDDYYYSIWKQRNMLKKAPEEWQKDAKPPKYYSFDCTFPSKDYSAPSFAGALGRPTHSSSSQPRQIIAVRADSIDDQVGNDGAGGACAKQTAASRQKRLRAILMKIEKAALCLVDCRDIRRKLRFFEETCITEYIDRSEITDRLSRFAENIAFIDTRIFVSDQLPTVMLIQKGRQMVYDWLQFLCTDAEGEKEQQEKEKKNVDSDGGGHTKFLAHVRTFLEAMGKFARKICDDESLLVFVADFCTLFAQIKSEEALFSLLRCTNFEQSLIKDSKLVQFTLLSLLSALIQLYTDKNSPSPLSIQQLEKSGIPFLLISKMPADAAECAVSRKLLENDVTASVIKWKLIKQWLHGQTPVFLENFSGEFAVGSLAACQD